MQKKHFLFLFILTLVSKISFSNTEFRDLEGKVFNYPGPNCFGVAMFANDNVRTIRGVDLEEFSFFVMASCQRVESPLAGDIGTFHNGQDFIHAFMYLGNDLVLEKTGVDYLGQTPIHIRDISHTIYTFEASPECRRYGRGDRSCYNKLAFYRCQKGVSHYGETLSSLEEKIESGFKSLLEGEGILEEVVIELKELISDYERRVSLEPSNPILSGRVISFQKQLLFLKRSI
jgi:hypothetical protein